MGNSVGGVSLSNDETMTVTVTTLNNQVHAMLSKGTFVRYQKHEELKYTFIVICVYFHRDLCLDETHKLTDDSGQFHATVGTVQFDLDASSRDASSSTIAAMPASIVSIGTQYARRM